MHITYYYCYLLYMYVMYNLIYLLRNTITITYYIVDMYLFIFYGTHEGRRYRMVPGIHIFSKRTAPTHLLTIEI